MKKTIKKLEQIIAELGDVLTELTQQSEVDLRRFAEIENEQTFCKALERKREDNITPELIAQAVDSKGTPIKRGDLIFVDDNSILDAVEDKMARLFSHLNEEGEFVAENGVPWEYAVKVDDK